jgi:hypothetical protein
VDPLAAKYASLSPYNYAFNNPVSLNDPTGAEPPQTIRHTATNSTWYTSYTYDDRVDHHRWDGAQYIYNNMSRLNRGYTGPGSGHYWSDWENGPYSMYTPLLQGMMTSGDLVPEWSYTVWVYPDGVESKPFNVRLIGFQFRQGQQAQQENPLMRFADKAVSWEEWVKANHGLTYDEIVNQLPKRNGFPGGPKQRYVFDPLNPKAVIDMRHTLIVGKMGPAFGNANELLQLKTDPSSAMDPQDFYSNRLGYRFYNYVEGKGLTGWIVNNIISSPENFVNRLNGFMTNPAFRGPIFIDR